MGLRPVGEASAWARRLARTPFAAAVRSGAPLFVACGDPPRIAFATPALLDAFAAPDAQALESVLFASDSPGARRLARLAVDMADDAPPRLQKLRLFVARRSVSVSWLCARIESEGERVFVAMDMAAAQPAALGDAEPPPERAAVPPETATRFVWRLDAEGRFVAPDPALALGFGAAAPAAGETVEAFCARAGLGPEWPARIAARETFSGLEISAPTSGGDAVRLSGAPVVLGGASAYRGFRGFGVTISRPSAPAPAAAPPPAPPARETAPPGDAAALINLLQRQHGGAAAPATAPALAVINALAALLQPKKEARPAATRPASGAEIVVLRPGAAPEPGRERPEPGTVHLSSKERDAFKEIARALGVKVRPSRADPPEGDTEPLASQAPPPPSEEDLATLVDRLPMAALVVRDNEALFANRALLAMTGHADFGEFRERGGLAAMFRGRNPMSLVGDEATDIPVVGVGETILTVDAEAHPLLWNGAEADLIALRPSRAAEHQAQIRAIEREAAVQAARARDYAAALEAARDGMARIDRQGRLLGLNRGAEGLFGRQQNEAAGESFLALFLPPQSAEARAALESVTGGHTSGLQSFEAVARAQDGRLTPVRVEIGRFTQAPEPDYFLLFSVSTPTGGESARAALAQAERSNEAKTELLSRVSHELRTPLHAILGFAEVILEERFGPIGAERYRDYLTDILSSGRHVLSLVDDLTDITRIELGKMELTFAPLDVNAIVRECVTIMQPQASRERVIMRMSLIDRPPKVMADARSLKQILLNLMTNAVKYNAPGGQVIVSTALDDSGGVVMRVRDTGVGMSESELAIALEPFRRVPGARATQGTGIGLPLTKALAKANHADFTIRSRKNQGTLVEIAFPVQHAAQ